MSRLSETDAYVLRRAMARMEVNLDAVSPAVGVLLRTINPAEQAGWNLLMEAINADVEIAAQVMKIDPKQPPALHSDDAYIPDLPSYAQPSAADIKAANSVCRWHTEFMRWSVKRSPMTPPIFLEAGSVYLLGLAIARRVCLQVHDRIFPHLYLLWIAETTRYAKSTGLKTVIDLAQRAMPHMLMPSQSTPEALLEAMAGELPENFDRLNSRDRSRLEKGRTFAAQRGLLIDEASSLLGAAKKDYMAGLQEFILEAYDAPDSRDRSTRAGGLIIVKRLALSILGATTPAAMARTVTADKWEDGEMARYGLLFPEGAMKYDDSFTDEFEPPDHLVKALAKLHDALPAPPVEALDGAEVESQRIIYASAAPEVLKAFKTYRRAMHQLTSDELDLRLHGNYGRLPVQVVKVAIALAAMDWANEQAAGNPLRIEYPHWVKAQMIVEKWRASLHRLLPVLTESHDSRIQARILTILKQAPAGLTARDISRRLGTQTKRMESAFQILIESGLIEAVEVKAPTGPKTKVYRRCN